MSETNHTPGPWKAVDLRHQKNGKIKIEATYPNFGHIANVLTGSGFVRTEMEPHCEANARLIAAAPDMLAALKAIQKEFVGDRNSSNVFGPLGTACDLVHAAIAKAGTQ